MHRKNLCMLKKGDRVVNIIKRGINGVKKHFGTINSTNNFPATFPWTSVHIDSAISPAQVYTEDIRRTMVICA